MINEGTDVQGGKKLARGHVTSHFTKTDSSGEASKILYCGADGKCFSAAKCKVLRNDGVGLTGSRVKRINI